MGGGVAEHSERAAQQVGETLLLAFLALGIEGIDCEYR
jgi:hypothetical protein